MPDVLAPVLPNRELVFTVPQGVEHLVQPTQRLDLLVTDVIARARQTLHIGGPFWNIGEWELLRPVILPALESRGVHVTFYLHRSESGRLPAIEDTQAPRRAWPRFGAAVDRRAASLMHAKFVIADGTAGYFGTTTSPRSD